MQVSDILHSDKVVFVGVFFSFSILW